MAQKALPAINLINGSMKIMTLHEAPYVDICLMLITVYIVLTLGSLLDIYCTGQDNFQSLLGRIFDHRGSCGLHWKISAFLFWIKLNKKRLITHDILLHQAVNVYFGMLCDYFILITPLWSTLQFCQFSDKSSWIIPQQFNVHWGFFLFLVLSG